ncbi:hypothetical protein LX32DRAFT_657349 [Colletotrichum zoysiae]|uniref:Secreted protein n=1 Tax=Colletotrichum zoysiae TaxID=1216348 RepID=A0AAD9H622_9PEZI|nr:hypothetical protein LX32DRAFT_657349 [Colletotrichum zoysiae]
MFAWAAGPSSCGLLGHLLAVLLALLRSAGPSPQGSSSARSVVMGSICPLSLSSCHGFTAVIRKSRGPWGNSIVYTPKTRRVETSLWTIFDGGIVDDFHYW